MKKVKDLFEIKYGTSNGLNQLEISHKGTNFVSRTSKNNGVSAKVKLCKGIIPLKAGLISVAVGGTVMESFVQPREFYTGYHILVLIPKRKMTLKEKQYYCMCLKNNKYRYSYGRQANRTLKDIELPDKIPDWVYNLQLPDYSDINKPYSNRKLSLKDRQWKEFRLKDLFKIERGSSKITTNQAKVLEGSTLFISASTRNNGCIGTTKHNPDYKGLVITIANAGQGSVGFSFYQPYPFSAASTINILIPNFKINSYIGCFLITLIKKERPRYSFGRGWSLDRMGKSKITLPVTQSVKPDWQFMEDYIKGLDYSKRIGKEE